MTWTYSGSDFAHYQDEHGALVDWPAVRNASDWAFTKMSQRDNYVDPSFDRHRTNMHDQKFRTKGLYHWQSPISEASIARQVQRIKKTSGGFEVGECFMVDAEQAEIREPDTFELASTVEDDTHRPSVLYFGVYTAGGTLAHSQRLRMSLYGRRTIILAAYVTEARLAQILIQQGLQDLIIDANQFGSSGIMPSGLHVPGVVGPVDMNQVNNLTAFDLSCGLATQKPTGDIVNHYTVAGATAQFIGTPDRVRWTGPGDDKISAAIAGQVAAGNLVEVNLTGGPSAFAWTFLDGPLPIGDTAHTWDGSEFANTAEILARVPSSTVDEEARRLAGETQAAIEALRLGLHNL